MTTVVLGLDGGCFELLQPWIDDGTLPTFSKPTKEGVATYIQLSPPIMCLNWQCYVTGTNPGKLGVFWWGAVDRYEQTVENWSASVDFDGVHCWRFIDGDTQL